jgi:hypothetical protein
MRFEKFYLQEDSPTLRKILKRVGNKKLGYDDVEINPDFGKFLLPDGNYLSFDNDHRYILGMADMEDEQMNRTEQLMKLMKKTQLIRVIPESGVFQIVSKITSDQKRTMLDYLTINGSIEVEFGENRMSQRYNKDEYYELEEKLSGVL